MFRTAYHDVGFRGEPTCVISLGYSSCGEHERGFKTMTEALRLNANAEPGIARRTMTATSEQIEPFLKLFDFPKATKTMSAETRIVLDFRRYGEHWDRYAQRKSDIATFTDKEMSTAWDGSGFMIRGFSEDARQMVKDLYAAFLSGDLAIGSGPDVPFSGNALVLTIPSRMPRETLDKIKADDENHDNLMAAAKKTGIAEKLREAGRGSFALKPQWATYFQSLVGREGKPSDDTEHDVIFFLNPMQQDKHKHGWFTVEELEMWIDGAGPVMKGWEAPVEAMVP